MRQRNNQRRADAEGVSGRPARWRRGCALLGATLVLGLLLFCSIGVAGVWRGRSSLPWFDGSFGPLHIVGYSTWNASCQPYSGCAPTLHEAYVIWFILEPESAGRRLYRVLSLPLAH